MKNTPLKKSEKDKILIFSLFLLPTILIIIGIIPMIIILLGIFMMKKNNDFSYIETAVRVFKIYCYFLIFIIIIFILKSPETGMSIQDSLKMNTSFLLFMFFMIGLVVFYIVLINTLFFAPLYNHVLWVENNGIFTNKSKNIGIIKSEKRHSFSVAEEIIKWAKLKEDGHITEEKFLEVKNKLLE